MTRAIRIAAGFLLGSLLVATVQACCGEDTVRYDVEVGTYTLEPYASHEPSLQAGTLTVEESMVTLDYVTESGEVGTVVWEVVEGSPVEAQ